MEKTVKGHKGYVYDDDPNSIKTDKDGKKYYHARFDEKTARKLGMSEEEINDHKSGKIDEDINVYE